MTKGAKNLEGIKIKLELNVDIEVLKKVLEERGFEPSIANMKKIGSIYKSRSYSITTNGFFKDLPKDEETLLMYGLKPKKNHNEA